MENKRPLIVTGLVLLIILALIVGVVFYLINFIRSRQTVTTQQLFPQSSSTVFSTVSPSASPSQGQSLSSPVPTSVPVTTKVYRGQGFQLQYPSSWGLLTCNNSQNIELDPTNSADQLNVSCSRAVKPITVLVGQYSCSGGTDVNLGGISVQKKITTNFQTTSGGSGKEYHWCTNTSPALDITHRVGTGTAFSSQDYSAQVEKIISSFNTGSGGS